MRSEKTCLFARQAPEIDREGDMFFLLLGGDHADIGVKPGVLRAFVASASEALLEYDRGNIVRFPRRRGRAKDDKAGG